MIFTYVLSYNPLDEKVSALQLIAFIRDNRKILQYYQPWVGTYVFKSAETLPSLTDSFSDLFHGSNYIISATYPSQMGGLLAANIWEWLNTNVIPTVPALSAITKSGDAGS